MIRVLLADDHEIVRLGLRSVLEGAEDIEVAVSYTHLTLPTTPYV